MKEIGLGDLALLIKERLVKERAEAASHERNERENRRIEEQKRWRSPQRTKRRARRPRNT